MKISGPRGLRPTTTARVNGRGSTAGGAAFTLPAEAPEAAAVGGARPTAAVDSLLALQEVPDATSNRARAWRRGHDLLDQLDRLRHALLLGSLDRGQLTRLARLVSERRAHDVEPALAGVLAEIEVRAAVELAKLERA